MKVDLFDFHLPEERIALRPLPNRSEAKLLHVGKNGVLSDYQVSDLVHLVRPGDALVFNDTKVLPASLLAIRKRFDTRNNEYTIAKLNINLHMRLSDNCWRAFVKPLRRIQVGEELIFVNENNEVTEQLTAKVIEKNPAGEVTLEFNKSGVALNEAMLVFGKMPIPPYIASRRNQDEQDAKDYQTIFAKNEGAVAAPTAGLHFTHTLLKKLSDMGVEIHFLTLHVGAGTFLPVKVDDTVDHKMHSEYGCLSEDTTKKLNEVKRRGKRIISVGTTSLRLLESAAVKDNCLEAWYGFTDIFITPGYKFKFVDSLITNFHLPKSTLFMLVCAFSGMDVMKKAYEHAIDNNYRFYSYGDASFLELK